MKRKGKKKRIKRDERGYKRAGGEEDSSGSTGVDGIRRASILGGSVAEKIVIVYDYDSYDRQRFQVFSSAFTTVLSSFISRILFYSA